MLFDLQSPGRRRIIKFAFAAMAVLFALSFVFLGVGSGGAGLGDILGGGGGGDDNPFEEDVKAAEERLAVNPADPQALSQLVELHYQAGSQQVEVDENGLQFLTSDGEQELQEGADAWAKYQKAIAGGKVNETTALLAVQTFAQLADTQLRRALTATSGTDALGEANSAVASWKEAAGAQQVLVTLKPNASDYSELAFFLYRSGQIPAGDQATAQAVALSKVAEQKQVQNQLDQVKKQGEQLTTGIAQLSKEQQQAASGGGDNPLGDLGASGGLSGGGISGGGLSTP